MDWKSSFTTKAIISGTWQFPNGKKTVLLFVNASDDSLFTRIEFDSKDYGFPDKTLRATKVTPTGTQEKFITEAVGKITVEFPPRCVFAWEIVAAQGNQHTTVLVVGVD